MKRDYGMREPLAGDPGCVTGYRSMAVDFVTFRKHVLEETVSVLFKEGFSLSGEGGEEGNLT